MAGTGGYGGPQSDPGVGFGGGVITSVSSGRSAAGKGGAAVSSVPLELAELVKITTQVASKFDSCTNERGTPSMPVRPWLTSVEHVV